MRLKSAVLFCIAASLGAAYAQLLAPNTQIENQAFLDLIDSADAPVTVPSNIVKAIVQPVYGLNITPNTNPSAPYACGQSGVVVHGTSGLLTYTVTNTGNTMQDIGLAVAAPNASDVNGLTATPLAPTQIYQETNGTPGWQEGDTVISTTDTATVQLAAGASTVIYVRASVPTGAIPATTYGLNLVGTTPQDTTLIDNNNIGCLVTATKYDLTMTQVPAQTAYSPDTKVFTHVIENTGNAILNTSDIAFLPANSTFPFTTFYKDAAGNISDALTPIEALSDLFTKRGYGLRPGEQISMFNTYKVPAGVKDGTQGRMDFKPYITIPSTFETGGTVYNALPQPLATSHLDIINVIGAGVGTIYKRQSNCGNNTMDNCATTVAMRDDPAFAASLNIKSCDVIKYGLFFQNAGPGPLFRPIIRDTVPPNMTGIFINPLWTSKYNALLRINGGEWRDYTGFIATNPQNLSAGTLIEVGIDTNNDKTMTGDDQLPAGFNSGVTFFNQLKDAPSCSSPTGAIEQF